LPYAFIGVYRRSPPVAFVNYIDSATGASYPLDKPRWCGDGGAYLNLGDAPGLTRSEIDTSRRSVWRYAKALLVDAKDAVTLGEGWTPLVCGKLDGVAVTMKLEFMMPTGSFKDRGMTTLITYLKSRGIESVLEDSSGNAGASLAAYAAAAGMRARILVPQTASYPKIAQMAATGADVVTIKGSRQDVAEAALRYAKEIFYTSHNWQPFFLEGTKTLAYELWEQLGFKIPDNIVFPVGYGSNVCGCERGFAELKRRGEIDRVPRLFGVQAANCAPYYAAFKAGVEELVPTTVTATIAEGIASSKPTRVREVLRAVRGSGGSLLAVTEEEIVSALGALARQGLYVEPTSAAAAAGLRQLLRERAIAPQETTVLVLTGSGLKASEKIGQLLKVDARAE
jgi:threonine synthase